MKRLKPNWQDVSIYGSIIDLFNLFVGDLDIYLFIYLFLVYLMTLLVASIPGC